MTDSSRSHGPLSNNLYVSQIQISRDTKGEIYHYSLDPTASVTGTRTNKHGGDRGTSPDLVAEVLLDDEYRSRIPADGRTDRPVPEPPPARHGTVNHASVESTVP